MSTAHSRKGTRGNRKESAAVPQASLSHANSEQGNAFESMWSEKNANPKRQHPFPRFRLRAGKEIPEAAADAAATTDNSAAIPLGLRAVDLRSIRRVILRNPGSLVLLRKSDLAVWLKKHVEAELPSLIDQTRTDINPLAAARARGRAYKQDELAKSLNLSIDHAAARAGLSQKWINTLRQRGELYALVPDGQTRKFRYPAWQFDADKGRLVPVLGALSNARVGCWGVHSFMHTPSPDIDGKTPREWILDPDLPLAELLTLVERRFADDQGAQ